MGNEGSADQNSQDADQNQFNNSQPDNSSMTSSNLEPNENNITNDMFPNDLKDDQSISPSLEIDDIDSLTIEKSCPAFDEILNYSKSRVKNFQSSFRTKAIVDCSLQNTLTSLNNSIKENKNMIKKGEEQKDDNKNLKSKKRLEQAQHLSEQAQSSFDQNQSQVENQTISMLYADIETAKENLVKKRNELDDLKKTCLVLQNQYLEILNSQNS